MDDLVGEFNAEAHRLNDEVAVDESDGRICYRIAKVSDRFLQTHTFDLILALAKRHSTTQTVIDLARCRALSSVELSLMGFIITQVRFYGGTIRVENQSPVNEKALAMVGFDRLVDLTAS